MSLNASVGEMSRKSVCTMDVKATESIHAGRAGCASADGTERVVPAC